MSSPGVGPTGPENPSERKTTNPAALAAEESAPGAEEQTELLRNAISKVGPTGPENP